MKASAALRPGWFPNSGLVLEGWREIVGLWIWLLRFVRLTPDELEECCACNGSLSRVVVEGLEEARSDGGDECGTLSSTQKMDRSSPFQLSPHW